MPYCDMPILGEETAPEFNTSDIYSIWDYFEDLEVLFCKHHVSDDSEKKQAAVGYLATKERRVWKSSPSFKNLDCSYEDFKAEVIKMYPEAKEGNYFSFSGLQELVSDRACKEIGSLQEFGKYYREFLLISRHLIAMGRIGVQEQERLFLRSFEPTLASAIYSRLETKFLDRTDRYEMEEILDAAIYVLKPQFGMSRVPLLPVIQRYIQPSDVSSPFPSTTSVAPAF